MITCRYPPLLYTYTEYCAWAKVNDNDELTNLKN